MADDKIPLKAAKPTKALPDYLCWLGANAFSFLSWLTAHLYVDGSALAETALGLLRREEPEPADRDKIWFYDSDEGGFAVYRNGSWQHGWLAPKGMLVRFDTGEAVAPGWVDLTEQELTDRELTNTSSTVWRQFRPTDLNL